MGRCLKNHLALQCLERFILLVIMCNCDPLVAGRDTISLGSSLREKQTIISKNGTFELGCFNPNGTSNWYVGIWYAQISEKTIIWVANRETPIKNMPGVFSLSKSGYLSVSDLQGEVVWSTNHTQQAKASMASILDTGNFVLLGAQNTSEIVWESFAYPTDHFMPTMKLWKGLKWISWKSSVDPAPGKFIHQMNPSPGKTEFLLQYENGVSYYSTGEWTGMNFYHFSGAAEARAGSIYNDEFVTFSPTRMYYTFWYTRNVGPKLVRHVLKPNGELLSYFWVNNGWYMVFDRPESTCGVYGVCGAYGICFKQENVQSCNCMDGFHPRNATFWSSQDWWLSGCARDTPLNCSSNTTDGFLQVTDKSISDKENVQYIQESLSLQGCKTACLNNCSCTAFAFTDSNPAVCKLWFGDLLSVHSNSNSFEDQPFFIRLAAADALQLSAKRGGGKTSMMLVLSISIPLGIAVLGTLLIGAWVFIQRRRRRQLEKVEGDGTQISLRIFRYKDLKIATNKFRHKLGKGAFGCVFKGTLSDNTLVAVKKLEDFAQGEKQFRAEISTIGNIHHVNLVRLMGFCVEGSHRMLVYEYMHNGSLNSFLSRKSLEEEEDKVLDWKTRFLIALGTARGLLYLHEGCRDRIIHCDVKPENILLDANFCPKVADFGLAKLIGRDFSKVLTTTRGTIGYLAPEWLTGVPITVKVDVYSFGMTLLEIISGRRNNDLSVPESQHNFPTWAATQIVEGNTIRIVDERIADKADVEEVRRAIVVCILCIQEDENTRPTMAQVVQILEGKFDGNVEQYERCLRVLIEDHCAY